MSWNFSDRLSGLFDTIREGAKIAGIEFWFLIMAIIIAVIVAMISKLIVGIGGGFRGW